MNSTWKIIFTAILFMLLAHQPVWAASTKDEVLELQKEVGELKMGQETIQKELAEIKQLLKSGARGAPAQPGFKPSEVTIDEAPFLGETDAIVTLMEFSDYQCPFCSRHYREVMPTLVQDYVETGQLKYVMRENPIPSIHSRAIPASMAALCAKDQGRYWEMHNLMFDNPKQLSDENLRSYAATAGLNAAEFNDCYDGKKYEKRVNDDLAAGRALGVRGTPAFVVGLTDPDDPNKANMTEFINGAKSLDEFKRIIDEMLESAP